MKQKMNIELTKSQRLLLCGGLIGLASLMLQACETVMKENEDVREKICGNWQSAEAGPMCWCTRRVNTTR